MTLIQIDGISGTGKTTLSKELIKRGRKAIDADAEFGYFGDPKSGKPTDEQHQLNWIWDVDKIASIAKSSADETVYICGGAMNQDKVKDLFKKRFTLVIDDATMKHRLLNRTNNDFGKNPDDLTRQLEWNKGVADYARSIGSTVVDATRPVEQVAQEIIQAAE